jgi:hypothetical protein
MNKPDIFDLYTDYLITSFSYTTATGLSNLVDDAVSLNEITRFLSQQDFTSKYLWKVSLPVQEWVKGLDFLCFFIVKSLQTRTAVQAFSI